MISSRWKKVWSDFWGNRGRTFLTIATIAVGAFAVGFNSNMGLYMNESMDGDYLSANPSEAQVYTSPLGDDEVEVARTVPGVDTVEGSASVSAQILRPDGTKISINLIALEDPDKLSLNLLKPAQGETDIPKYESKEVILDASAISMGYKPGDVILLELESGKQREIKLAGYVHDVTGFPYNLTNQASGYVTPDTLEWLGGSTEYNMLAISVKENPTDQDHVTEIAQAVGDRMKDA